MSEPREDKLGVVQFIHPGKEQTAVRRDGWCEWNSATRSDAAWPHRRKFLISRADYEQAGRFVTGTVGLWGEWEGPSFARKVDRVPGRDEPEFFHVPAYYEPTAHDGLLDTDPFVFGSHFLYCGCQQHTSHHKPGGAAETFLRRLSGGSLILFGSAIRREFVLDTAFVVGAFTDYANGDFAEIQQHVPPEYVHLSLWTQFKGNDTCDSFRLYRGATLAAPVHGMHSFVPCRPFGDRVSFARPRLALDGVITQNLTQGKKLTPAEHVDAVRQVWLEVKRQVEAAGCALAHRVHLEPTRVNHPRSIGYVAPAASAAPAVPPRAHAGQHVVEKVHTREAGEHFAIRAPGKAKAYTQSMPECRAVTLRPDDRVADVGSFIGEFSIMAARAGVQRVRAFEPTPASFEVLSMNLAPHANAEAVHAAVVANGATEVDLYLSEGNGTRNRIDAVRGRRSIRVPAVSYADAVAGATVIKIDTEGAEWTFPIVDHLAPPLRAIIIEFHPREDAHVDAARRIIAGIEAAGFRMVYPQSDEKFWQRFETHGKQWAAHRTWVRGE